MEEAIAIRRGGLAREEELLDRVLQYGPNPRRGARGPVAPRAVCPWVP